MSVYKCMGRAVLLDDDTPACNYEALHPWRGRCPKCGMLYEMRKFGPDGTQQRRKAGQVITLAAAPMEKPVPRVATGVKEFDELTSGGLPEATTTIISGPSGAGKTTLDLMLAEGVAKLHKRPVLFASSEEGQARIYEKANRLGASSELIKIMPHERNLHLIMKRVEEIRPIFLIIDSIQEMLLGHVAPGTQIVECIRYIKRVCEKRKIAALLVSHVSRGSGDVRGPTTMDHIVDAMLEFDPPRDVIDQRAEMERIGYRRLKLAMKTRIGPPGVRYFNMTLEGILTPIDEDTFYGRKKKRVAFEDEGAPRPRADWTKSRLRVVSDETTKPDGGGEDPSRSS